MAMPIELILARNLASSISIPALLTDADGRFVFYNEAASDLMGAPFEEIGVLEPAEWNAKYGPLTPDGRPVPQDELPLAIAVREAKPAFGRLSVRAERGVIEIEVGAVPLTGPSGYHGAMLVFWPVEQAAG